MKCTWVSPLQTTREHASRAIARPQSSHTPTLRHAFLIPTFSFWAQKEKEKTRLIFLKLSHTVRPTQHATSKEWKTQMIFHLRSLQRDKGRKSSWICWKMVCSAQGSRRSEYLIRIKKSSKCSATFGEQHLYTKIPWRYYFYIFIIFLISYINISKIIFILCVRDKMDWIYYDFYFVIAKWK